MADDWLRNIDSCSPDRSTGSSSSCQVQSHKTASYYTNLYNHQKSSKYAESSNHLPLHHTSLSWNSWNHDPSLAPRRLPPDLHLRRSLLPHPRPPQWRPACGGCEWAMACWCLLFGFVWFTALWHTYVHYVTYPFSESQFAQSGTIAPTSQFGRKEPGNNAFVEKIFMEPREEAVSFRSDQSFLKDHHSTREKHMCSTCWTCKHQLQTEQIIWLGNWN